MTLMETAGYLLRMYVGGDSADTGRTSRSCCDSPWKRGRWPGPQEVTVRAARGLRTEPIGFPGRLIVCLTEGRTLWELAGKGEFVWCGLNAGHSCGLVGWAACRE